MNKWDMHFKIFKHSAMFLIVFLFSVLPLQEGLGQNSKHQDPISWQNPSIIAELKNSMIEVVAKPTSHALFQHKPLFCSSDILLVSLKTGTKAIFKTTDNYNEAQAELIAYRFSQFLGFPLIPPTVLRTINGKRGSLQLFLENALDMTNDVLYQKILEKITPDELAKLQLFYFLLGHWDGTRQNLLGLVNHKKTHLVSIDHAKTCLAQYMQYGGMPYTLLVEHPSIPDSNSLSFHYSKLQEQTVEDFKKKYKEALPSTFDQHYTYPLEKISFCLYKNGIWVHKNTINTDQIVNPCPKTCSKKTYEMIKKLTREKISEIFNIGEKVAYFTPTYLEALEDRRNQLLKKFGS